MKNLPNIYFKINETTGLAFNRKVGSSSLSRALALITPEVTALRISYPDDGLEASRIMWQRLCPKIENPSTVLLPVREPVARFVSAMQFISRYDVDDVLTAIEGGDWVNAHLLPQSELLLNTTKLYKFPEHLEALASAAGFAWPLPTINESKGEPLTLTEAQTARVASIYAADAALFESIATAGQVLTVPAAPVVQVSDYAAKRRMAYLNEGITTEALAVAMREKIGENRPEAFDALQAKVQAIKLLYPKP